MAEYLEKLKTKRAQKLRDPNAFDSNAHPRGPEEELRKWYRQSPIEDTQEPKAEPKQQPTAKKAKGTKKESAQA